MSKFRKRAALIVLTGLLLVAAGLLAGLLLLMPVASPSDPVRPTVGYAPATITRPANNSPVEVASCSQVAATDNLTTRSPAVVTPGVSATRTVGAAGSSADRYGLIITGLQQEKDKIASIRRMVELSQAKWWYQYTPEPVELPASPLAQQVYLVRVGRDDFARDSLKKWTEFIRSKGHFDRPTYWLIGNEPNVPGQDDCSPEGYATALAELNRLIRLADPQATLIGPNVLNWDHTCEACPGFPSGLEWVEKLRQIYRSRYGQEPPFDAWSLHTYSLDWNHLPLINQPQDAAQLEALRRYLDQSEATRNKPIWLSEFGVVWGYDDLEWQKDASGRWLALPKGRLRQDLMAQYLQTSLDWLEANATRLGLARWFVYTSYGEPESFTNTFSGLALFNSPSPQADLTNFGLIYKAYLSGTRPKA